MTIIFKVSFYFLIRFSYITLNVKLIHIHGSEYADGHNDFVLARIQSQDIFQPFAQQVSETL